MRKGWEKGARTLGLSVISDGSLEVQKSVNNSRSSKTYSKGQNYPFFAWNGAVNNSGSTAKLLR